MKRLRQGDQLIVFACRCPSGSMKHTNGRTREEAFCPGCQFTYRGPGCIFTPRDSSGQRFGKNASAKPPRRDYAPRRVINNPTGGRWIPQDILEVIIEYHERTGKWPKNTTTFRDCKRLPHNQTVSRYFGSVAEAVKQAQELMEKENSI